MEEGKEGEWGNREGEGERREGRGQGGKGEGGGKGRGDSTSAMKRGGSLLPTMTAGSPQE